MNILDLFCGAGGLSYGFEKAGFNSVLGVDMNPAALETYRKNHHNSMTLCGDLTSDELKEKIVQFAKDKNVVGILGGPPCQGFSLKGKKLGLEDSRNYLFQEYLAIVEEINPQFIVMENVKALTNRTNKFFLDSILDGLKKLGYQVTYQVLNAKDYGVPQSRERVFVIATKDSLFDFSTIEKQRQVNVEDAISDLNYLASGQGNFEQDYNLSPISSYQEDMRKNSLKLFNHQATNHSDLALNKLALIPPEGDKKSLPKELWGNQKFDTTWGRLKWKKVSPTIDTRFDTPSNGCNSHPVLNRAITPREAARLQSFPDNFIFYGKKTDICKQIGNAVPPRLAYQIALAVKKNSNNEF
ncbi:DNA cytosine methyltransferase [Pasteurellaceae bacterium LFhippo2]|nr:DNA cytosine methyltransferase [Pasteurellaceae bacterium LFhippo2]